MLVYKIQISRRSIIASVLITVFARYAYAEEKTIQFNTDVLDVQDRGHIDLSQFSRAGYVMPGTYALSIQINKSSLPEQQITFLVPDNDKNGSEACLTNDIVTQFGLTTAASKNLSWWHNGECLDPTSLQGMVMRTDMASNTLFINLPQAYLDYVAENWDPPSRWDEGVAGILFDYNLNGQSIRQKESGNTEESKTLSGNGTTGMNVGAWRFRADWQGQMDKHSGNVASNTQNFEWNRYYLYRAVPSMRAKMTLGEDYLTSDMFDSFRFTGVSLVSSDNMLPPNLRGYAPEVTGLAKTNAKVTISQQGRVLNETTVAAGPFRIQDLNNAVSGTLDVKITEQDGSVQTYQINTSTIPYLTRPGMVRYKLAAGKPSDFDHHSDGPIFGTGEFSWGVNNGWSLYGGALVAGDYNAISIGIGRDLLALGAISIDATESRARLPQQESRQGGSYKVSYSKRFDSTDSQVTFAGYRFSERGFMSMTDYLDARYHDNDNGGSGKEMYTVTFNQQIKPLNMSIYLDYSRQTYWDHPSSTTYNVSLSHYFDIASFKNLSLSISAFRTTNNDTDDRGAYMSLSVPWGESGYFNYGNQISQDGASHSLSYSDRIDKDNSYQISLNSDQNGVIGGSGYLTHDGDAAEVTATATQQGNKYSSMGLSVRGGMTATARGAALHRMSVAGGTRMMVDADGVSGVPVKTGGNNTHTNAFGKAVVGDVSSYYRNSMNIDMDELGDDVDASRSVVQGTLTEGAIGYRKFGIIAGQKAMAILRLTNNSVPPFGAMVTNKDKEQTGLVSEDGIVWLTGIKPGEVMSVSWDGSEKCHINLPAVLPPDLESQKLLLPCTTADSIK
ncbi:MULTISPECIES: outer membrane usher protein [Enterobacter]|uniref:outer membrane usher protein n=1 Tax=Enterobacter TaxID=547 RepID=UPI00389987EF